MIEYIKELSNQDQERLTKVIQTLFDQTYLLERSYDKKTGRMASNKEFYFCDQHMEFLKEFFSIAGMEIFANMELGTIYLKGGSKLGNRLPKLSTIYLLVLKLIYDENMAKASNSMIIYTTFGDLNEKIKEFGLLQALSSITEIKQTIRILKKYQMIDITDTIEELNEKTRIIIYPCIQVILMQEEIKGLLQSFIGEEQEVLTDGNNNSIL